MSASPPLAVDILARLHEDGWLPRPPYTLPTHGAPWTVHVVGSPGTAGLTDFLLTVQSEPGLRVQVRPCTISDPNSVLDALAAARRGSAAVLAIVRGGGEHLDHVFNNARVVTALAQWPSYTVLGVGHATDTVLAGQVVDHEAITPTAAAHWLLEARRRVESRPTRPQPTAWRWLRRRAG